MERGMSQFDYQRIEVDYSKPVTLIKFRDGKILDQLLVKQLAEELRSVVHDEQRNRLLLDLGGVTFLSSAALNNLVILNRHVNKAAGKIVLAGLQPQVREVFTYTGLDRLFAIVESLDEGWKSFESMV